MLITARKFVLKNSTDGQSELTCYECTLHIYPSGGHGWGFRNTAQGFRYHVQMLDDLTTWLQHF